MCLATMAYAYPACPVRVTIFSTGSKFRPVSELHALTLAARSYVLLAAMWNMNVIGWLELYTHVYHKVRIQDLRWHIHNSAIWRQILWCVSHKGESIWTQSENSLKFGKYLKSINHWQQATIQAVTSLSQFLGWGLGTRLFVQRALPR